MKARTALLLGALVWGLLVPVAAPTAASDSPPTATMDMRARVLHVIREYGDGPVTVPQTVDKVRIRFHAGKGDKVRLYGAHRCPLVLRGPTRKEVPKDLSRFWRVRERGAQTI